MSDTQISEVHQSEGGEAGRTHPSAQGGGQPRSRVFWSSLSHGTMCRCPLWLWRLGETQAQMKAIRSRAHRLTRVLMHTGRRAARGRHS